MIQKKYKIWDVVDKRFRLFRKGDVITFTVESSGKYFELVQNEKIEVVVGFTGLLDKNGKEIYEGDVVVDRFGQKSQVVWNGGCFMLKEDTPVFLNQFTEIEIIGNIYENPELLK